MSFFEFFNTNNIQSGILYFIDILSNSAIAIRALQTLGATVLFFITVIFARLRVLSNLASELGLQHSTKTKPELKWIDKKYVEHSLCDIVGNPSLEIKASDVLKDIRHKKDYVVGVVGKAGLGKSQMLLWLYLKLAKSLFRRCAFIYIGSTELENKDQILDSIRRQLNTAKKIIPFCRAYIFIDAVDEAYNLFDERTTFNASFITELKKNIDIPDCNIVFSIRDECFQGGVNDIRDKCRTRRSKPTIYKILPMNQTQIISIYKSLKYAKRVEKYLSNKNSHDNRFQDTFPNSMIRKSIRYFTKYINNHPNTIFQYPVFMRYAYKLMEERDGTLDDFSLDNNLKAIGILVEKLIKWEFHAIKKTQAYFDDGIEKPEYQCFKSSIYKMIDLVLGDMITDRWIKHNVSRDTVVSAYNLIFSNETNEREDPLQVAHCLFSWNTEGTSFEFHNSILWDYFVSGYINKPIVNYTIRKFMFNHISENTRLFQSVIQIYFQRLFTGVSAKASNELLNNSERGKQISINTISKLCLTEYYRVLPFDDWSFVCPTGAVFKAKTINNIIENHMLDLCVENMPGINCSLDICKLCTEDEIETLTHIAFHEITDNSFDISFLFEMQNLQYVTLPPYHKTFLQMGELIRSTGRLLHLWHRTPYQEAVKRFRFGINTANDIELLKIILELEIEETEFMGLTKPDYQSTCWTALSLIEAYKNKSNYLTNNEQYITLISIKNAIISNYGDLLYENFVDEDLKILSLALHYRFCYDFGRVLINNMSNDAFQWLVQPYNDNIDAIFIKFNRLSLGCVLALAFALAGDMKNAQYVLDDLEKIYKNTEVDNYFCYARCLIKLLELKANYNSPSKTSKINCYNALKDYLKLKEKNDMHFSLYASEYFMIIGDYINAKIALSDLYRILKLNKKNKDDIEYHTDLVMYYEMILLYMFLVKDNRRAIIVANKLLGFTNYHGVLPLSVYKYIKNKCEANLNPDIGIDETLYQEYDFFRRKIIWYKI